MFLHIITMTDKCSLMLNDLEHSPYRFRRFVYYFVINFVFLTITVEFCAFRLFNNNTIMKSFRSQIISLVGLMEDLVESKCAFISYLDKPINTLYILGRPKKRSIYCAFQSRSYSVGRSEISFQCILRVCLSLDSNKILIFVFWADVKNKKETFFLFFF